MVLKFGVEFVPMDSYWRTILYSIQAEKAGYDTVFVTDHYNNRSVYVILTNLAVYTRRVKFGPGVTNPYTSHPIITAQSVASLAEMAPGRVVCGLGSGDKTTLDQLGVERVKPLKAVREAVKIIKDATTTGKVKFDGEVFRVAGARMNFKPPTSIPVYVGAQGPKMLRLAAEVGDGVLINASHPKDFHEAMKHVREGAEKAGRRLDEIEVVAATSFSVAEDEGSAVKAATPVVAFIVAGCPEQVLEAHGIRAEDAQRIRDAIVKGDFKGAFSAVTNDMIEAFSITGTPDRCVERIEELRKAGVTLFITGSPIGPDVRASIKLFSERVMPHFRE